MDTRTCIVFSHCPMRQLCRLWKLRQTVTRDVEGELFSGGRKSCLAMAQPASSKLRDLKVTIGRDEQMNTLSIRDATVPGDWPPEFLQEAGAAYDLSRDALDRIICVDSVLLDFRNETAVLYLSPCVTLPYVSPSRRRQTEASPGSFPSVLFLPIYRETMVRAGVSRSERSSESCPASR